MVQKNPGVSICVEKTKSKVRMSSSVEKTLHRVWISSCIHRKDSVQNNSLHSLDEQLCRITVFSDKQFCKRDSVQSLDVHLCRITVCSTWISTVAVQKCKCAD
jgi:hypothetical protein